MRAQNPSLYSPYFHPEYTQIVSALRDDVRIVCAYDSADRPIAFLPFQGRNFCRPVGAPMTDYHGFICEADSDFDAKAILRQTGIGAFHFSALVSPKTLLNNYSRTFDEGVVLDLSQGAEHWRGLHDGSYRRHLKSTRRRIRKSEDEIGARRFEFNCRDQAAYDALFGWKTRKFTETGKYDVLSDKWTKALIDRLWEKTDGLRCDIHALYFGDQLAALDLGLTDGETFHSWMVGYNPDLHPYAPGFQLLEGLIDAALDLGYNRIDLGAGSDSYKRLYATEPVKIGSGFIAINGSAAALSKLYGAAEHFGEKKLGDAPGKLRRRYSQIAACEDNFSGRAKALLSAVKTYKRA